MLSFTEARAKVVEVVASLSRGRLPQSQSVDLIAALNRVLARETAADLYHALAQHAGGTTFRW